MTRFKITALNRPVETFARMSEPMSPEMLAESQVYQKQREEPELPLEVGVRLLVEFR